MRDKGTIVWFRQDLRLADHPALAAACARGGPVLPVFVWSPGEEGGWPPGAAARWWLHQSLASLDRDLRRRGSRLLLRAGPAPPALTEIAAQAGAGAVFWSRRHEPARAREDTRAEQTLRAAGLEVQTFNSALLFEPESVRTRAGAPYQVFTPFFRACLERPPPPEPLRAPARLPAPRRWPGSLPLAHLDLEPHLGWTDGLRAAWRPGEAAAWQRLDLFLEEAAGSYAVDRDRPDLGGTARLSPHLHFGEIGPRQIWHEAVAHAERQRGAEDVRAFLRQLCWREFAHHLLHHFPRSAEEPLRAAYAAFPWRRSPALLAAWQRGATGYPIIDAGMRELWQTGWLHNRARMIVASFLVKDLLISWLEGARWFWDTLVDADLANNTLGWQWAAGCGADAAPYFRIFNPVLQGRKWDPHGDYVRRFVPELAALPDAWIYRPWQAPAGVLERAGVRLGATYPRPIVDHQQARSAALAALAAVTGRGR